MSTYPSVVDRYYQRYTWNTEKQFKGYSGPTRILKHSNRILISCLHPDHPVRKQTIKSVTYQISEKCNRAANKVSGKRKKGGQWLNETAPILSVTTEESPEPILIQAGVRGHLIETNKKIVENPDLLFSASEGAGYLAIILPKGSELENPLTDEHVLDKDRVEADLLSDADAGSC